MSFSGIMENLVTGIIGGIFSSIIVSVVFYVLNEYQNELNKAKNMVYPLYGIIVISATKSVSGNFDSIDIARKYLDEATEKFSRFEPWQFKYELKDAMCTINEIIRDGKYYGANNALSEEMLHEFSEEIKMQLNKIENCERNFMILFLKRVIRNKAIIVAEITFIAMILIA